MITQKLKIIADGAILALANTAKFNEKLNDQTSWTYREFNDFILNVNKDSLIVFNTGWDNEWIFQFFINEEADQPYYRKFEQSIEITNNELHLINWAELTSALQFKNTTIPDQSNKDLKINLDNGFYKVIVKQISDPDHYEDFNNHPVNFIVELSIQPENPNIKVDEIVWAKDFPNDSSPFLSNQPNEFDEFLSNLMSRN